MAPEAKGSVPRMKLFVPVGLALMASCDAVQPAAPVDPTGSYVRSDGASMTVARAKSTAPHNYRLDLHQTARSGGYVQAGQDCYVVVVGTLQGNHFAGTSDMDEDNPESLSPAHLKRGVDRRTLGLEVRFADGGALLTDHFEGHACGAAFSGAYRKSR
jgi:hypothetical protein